MIRVRDSELGLEAVMGCEALWTVRALRSYPFVSCKEGSLIWNAPESRIVGLRRARCMDFMVVGLRFTGFPYMGLENRILGIGSYPKGSMYPYSRYLGLKVPK